MGWLKIHRDLLDWEWYKSQKHKSVFLDLLLNAQHTKSKYQGVEILPGQQTTSIDAISRRTNVSFQSVRTVLKDLKSTGEITIKTTRKYSMITITNWKKYQNGGDANIPTNNQLTNGQQTTNNLQEGKEGKEGKNNIAQSKIASPASNNENLPCSKQIKITEIVEHLNSLVGTKYKPESDATQKILNARLKTHSVDEIKKVVDFKVQEWKGDEKMRKYLRPKTLFNKSKFEDYLEQYENSEALRPQTWADISPEPSQEELGEHFKNLLLNKSGQDECTQTH
jgi:uncharacterized phage protein (TIGR02220 family)